jgi:CRP-like cAMP-binding protein
MHLDAFNNAGNLIYVAAYWVKDILWLRILSIAGSLIGIPYYLFQPEPLWPPIFWTLVFVSINSVRAWQIYLERRPVKFTPDEEILYDKTFNGLSPQHFLQLVKAGQWKDLDVGEKLQTKGRISSKITALVSGTLDVKRDGENVGSFGAGDLLGISFVLANAPEIFDSSVTTPARALQWDTLALGELTQSDPELGSALNKLASSTLAAKLVSVLERSDSIDATAH